MAFIKDSEHLSIPFQDIELATKNFTTLIGKGGYGKVYKGELSLSGKLRPVAVKRLDTNLSGQGFKEFLTEIQLLSRYKHPNLVSLVGFCHEGHEKILVYQYAERGSLDKYHHVDGKTCSLSWKQRINICVDAARGLNYLHNHVAERERVIHRDLKSANILLDHDWKAMIADLGLSKLGRANENETYLITNACGTQGYCDPAYIHTGVLTKESDVYSFGVVLFEVICGRSGFKNVNNEQRFLAQLAQRYYEEGNLNKIIDPCLKNQMEYSVSLNAVSKIAYQCLDSDREKRPSMEFVVEKLVEALELQVFDDFDFLFNTSYPRNEEINRMSDSPIVKSSRMQLYTHLSKGILVNGANVWLSVDDEGKNHELISATKFMHLDGKNCTETFAPQSRFPTVAKILDPSNINMQVTIVTQFLSSDITYAAYLVCKPTYHFPRGFHVTGSLTYELNRGRSLCSSYLSELDQSGWMMAELFQIVNPKRNVGFIVNFKRIDLLYQVQTSVIVEGIKFLPIHKVDDKEIGESDVENLPTQEIEWENHLPSDYKQFIYYSSKEMMAMPDQKDVIFPTKQEAYSVLSKGIRIKVDINDEKNVDMWFWITKLNGKKCFMLSPDSFSAPPSLGFWSAPATPDESRSGKVFFKENTRYIYMRFRLIYPLLSTKTTYACYLVYKMQDDKCFEHPSNVTIDCHHMNMEVTHLGIPVSERTPFCSFWSEKTRTIYLKRPRSPLMKPNGLIKYSNPLNKLSNMEFPRERNDGWWEVSLGEFISDYTPCDETTGITSLRPDYDSHISIMMRHLVMIEKLTVQGIEFRPL